MPALDDLNFERKLYVIRRKVRHAARKAGIPSAHFYIPSLSSRTIVYKGMLNPEQLRDFYPDLHERARRCRRWRWCTRASRPTPSPTGRARIPTG